MKRMKKIIALLAVIVMTVAAMPTTASVVNAADPSTDWQKDFFNTFCFSHSRFTAEEGVDEGSMLQAIWMTSEIKEYYDEDTNTYMMTYDELLQIVNTHYAKYDEADIKAFLTQHDWMSEDEMVKIPAPAYGSPIDYCLTELVELESGYYALRGVEIDLEYQEYVRALEVVLKENNETWCVVSYTELDDYYQVHETGSHFVILTTEDGEYLMYDFEHQEAFYSVKFNEVDGAEFWLSNTFGLGENNTSDDWYACDRGFEYYVECSDYYIPAVIAESPKWGDALGREDVIAPYSGSVELTICAEAILYVESPNATVEFTNGCNSYESADGYCTLTHENGANLTFKVTPDNGHEVSSVTINGKEVTYLESSDTYSAFPDLEPLTLVVTTTTERVIESSTESDVTVSIPLYELEQFEGLELVVEELEKEVEQKATELIVKNVAADDVYILDIYFQNEDGEETKVNATMTVTVPVPEGWDPERIAVYYVNPETGEVTDMGAMISEDGKTVSFQTTHFSDYALVQVAEVGESGEGTAIPEPPKTPAPQTGDFNNLMLWGTTFVSSLGVIVVDRKRRNK